MAKMDSRTPMKVDAAQRPREEGGAPIPDGVH